MDDSVKYQLQNPFVFDDRPIKELEIKMPLGKHLKKLPADSNIEIEAICELISRCSGIEMAILDKLKSQDFFAVIEIMSNFLGGGQKTGQS